VVRRAARGGGLQVARLVRRVAAQSCIYESKSLKQVVQVAFMIAKAWKQVVQVAFVKAKA
jgi:hypothetical protein